MIKKTFITALNKEISIYGSFSFFTGKKLLKEKLNLLDVSNHLKFFVEKKSHKKKLEIAFGLHKWKQGKHFRSKNTRFFHYEVWKKKEKHANRTN